MNSLSTTIINPSRNLVIGACMTVYMLEPFAMPKVNDVSFKKNVPTSQIKLELPESQFSLDYKKSKNLNSLLENQYFIKELIPEGSFKKERKYVKDGIRYVSDKETFINLGVDLFQLSTFIKQVGVLFDTHFNDEINDNFSANKHMMVKVQISSSQNCDTSVEDCYQLKVSFHSFDQFGKELTHFTKNVRSLPKIGFSNIKSKSVAEFQIFLNTKPENFIPMKKETKREYLKVSPFDVIG